MYRFITISRLLWKVVNSRTINFLSWVEIKVKRALIILLSLIRDQALRSLEMGKVHRENRVRAPFSSMILQVGTSTNLMIMMRIWTNYKNSILETLTWKIVPAIAITFLHQIKKQKDKKNKDPQKEAN